MTRLILIFSLLFLSACNTTPKIPLTPMQKFCKETWREADRWVSSCIGNATAAHHMACEYGREVQLQNKQYHMKLWIENDCANHPDPNR